MALIETSCATRLQDAERYWTRNRNEEGGGGYLAFSWDTAVWGADMMLTSLTDNNLVYQNEVSATSMNTAWGTPGPLPGERGGMQGRKYIALMMTMESILSRLPPSESMQMPTAAHQACLEWAPSYRFTFRLTFNENPRYQQQLIHGHSVLKQT